MVTSRLSDGDGDDGDGDGVGEASRLRDSGDNGPPSNSTYSSVENGPLTARVR